MTPNPEAVRALLVAGVPLAYASVRKPVTPVAPLATPQTDPNPATNVSAQ